MNRATRRAAQHQRPHRDRNDVALSAILRPIKLCAAFEPEEAALLSNETRMAWHRLTSGEGSEPDFDLLANCSNVAFIQAEKLGEPAVEIVIAAQSAIVAMRDRYLRTGKWGADAVALRDVPPVLDFYDQLLALASPAVMVNALEQSINRMKEHGL